jgi:hypothetical protein
VRLLHHAPRPALVIQQLAELCRPPDAGGPAGSAGSPRGTGGALVVLDYVRHDDESMREQADLWLGFEPAELRRFARAANLEDVRVTKIPAPLCGKGPDAHLAWQIFCARRGAQSTETRATEPVRKRKANHHG